jgi:hypothetical protein
MDRSCSSSVLSVLQGPLNPNRYVGISSALDPHWGEGLAVYVSSVLNHRLNELPLLDLN